MAEHKIPTVGGGIAHLWYHTSDSIYLLTQDWNAGALGEFRFMLGHFDGARWRFKPLNDTPEKVTGKYYSKYENRWMLGPDGRLGALGRDEAKGTYVLEIFDGLKNEERFELSLGTERTILDCIWTESEGVVLAFASKDSVILHKLDPFTGDMEQWRVVRLPPGSTEPTCGVDICEVGESFSIVVRPRPGPGDGRKCGAWTWDLSAKDSEDAKWRGIPEEERVETLTSDAGRPHMIEDAAGDKLLAYSTGRKVVLCAMTDGGDWKIINECSFPDGGEVRVCGLRWDGAGDHVELLIYVGPPPFGGSRRKRAFIVRMPTNG